MRRSLLLSAKPSFQAAPFSDGHSAPVFAYMLLMFRGALAFRCLDWYVMVWVEMEDVPDAVMI